MCQQLTRLVDLDNVQVFRWRHVGIFGKNSSHMGFAQSAASGIIPGFNLLHVMKLHIVYDFPDIIHGIRMRKFRLMLYLVQPVKKQKKIKGKG